MRETWCLTWCVCALLDLTSINEFESFVLLASYMYRHLRLRFESLLWVSRRLDWMARSARTDVFVQLAHYACVETVTCVGMVLFATHPFLHCSHFQWEHILPTSPTLVLRSNDISAHFSSCTSTRHRVNIVLRSHTCLQTHAMPGTRRSLCWMVLHGLTPRTWAPWRSTRSTRFMA